MTQQQKAPNIFERAIRLYRTYRASRAIQNALALVDRWGDQLGFAPPVPLPIRLDGIKVANPKDETPAALSRFHDIWVDANGDDAFPTLFKPSNTLVVGVGQNPKPAPMSVDGFARLLPPQSFNSTFIALSPWTGKKGIELEWRISSSSLPACLSDAIATQKELEDYGLRTGVLGENGMQPTPASVTFTITGQGIASPSKLCVVTVIPCFMKAQRYILEYGADYLGVKIFTSAISIDTGESSVAAAIAAALNGFVSSQLRIRPQSEAIIRKIIPLVARTVTSSLHGFQAAKDFATARASAVAARTSSYATPACSASSPDQPSGMTSPSTDITRQS